VAEGWTGWQWISGAAADWSGVSQRWPELVAVSRALHAALADVPVPSWRSAVENPWTIGDEVAWGERDPEPLRGSLAGQVRRLMAALRPVDLPNQLLHADLAGNVLFDDGMAPAVIDFSPLERPALLPLAIAAVDALMWKRARPEVLDWLDELLAGEAEFGQLLGRALVYRLVTETVLRTGTADADAAGRAGQPVTELILARLGR
jgi:hypothetical protein